MLPVARLALASALVAAAVAGCSSKSSPKSQLSIVSDATLSSNVVYGASSDDSVDWNTFVSTSQARHVSVPPHGTVQLDLPPAGHYRWGWLQQRPVPNDPTSVEMKLIGQDTFDSDGATAIEVHVADTGSETSAPGGDGGASSGGEAGVLKLCSQNSDCPGGFCVNQFCACDARGHTKCPCTSSGSACGDDNECCSLSCGLNVDGVCD